MPSEHPDAFAYDDLRRAFLDVQTADAMGTATLHELCALLDRMRAGDLAACEEFERWKADDREATACRERAWSRVEAAARTWLAVRERARAR